MSSPVAVADISYNSTDISDLTGIFIDRIEQGGPGTLPATDGTDDPVPGADGVYVRNRRKRTRTIELRGYVFGIGDTASEQIADLWDNRESVESLFAPDEHHDLVAVLRNGRTATIDCWPVSVDFNQLAPMLAEVSIVLQSTEPDWTVEATGS
jgi:hypothetical protein